MPRYDVEALEKFIVRTQYRNVEAAGAQEAEARCRQGCVPYDQCSIEEGDEEWLKTLEIVCRSDAGSGAADASPAAVRPSYGAGAGYFRNRFQDLIDDLSDADRSPSDARLVLKLVNGEKLSGYRVWRCTPTCLVLAGEREGFRIYVPWEEIRYILVESGHAHPSNRIP